ncbi:putative RNA-directed DNA polymerase from transposon BS [Trichonephila clavipes]|nr:putative RNA-directed DNA polymerase from transposon BS [Trichonephila clavipes]
MVFRSNDKSFGPTWKTEILDLLNNSSRLGRLPRAWKKAIVVPIRKPGKGIASAGSFRPIALTSITWLGFEPYLVYTFLVGIEKVINNDCEIGVFADDIVLWSSGSDTEKVEESVNLVLADVWSFAVNHKLNFSPSKSTVGFFTANRKLYNFRPRILLNSQPLEIEKHPRYLGFILDPEILNNRHLEHLALRASKCIKILKYISGRDWGADVGTQKHLRFPHSSHFGIWLPHLLLLR